MQYVEMLNNLKNSNYPYQPQSSYYMLTNHGTVKPM